MHIKNHLILYLDLHFHFEYCVCLRYLNECRTGWLRRRWKSRKTIAHLAKMQNVLNESLKLRLKFLAAKKQDPTSDPECQQISDELESATKTFNMFKRTMSLPETLNSSVHKGKESNVSNVKEDLSKLQITSDIPCYKDGHNSRDFLENMKQTVSSYIGDERFAGDCHRYLRYLTANTRSTSHQTNSRVG